MKQFLKGVSGVGGDLIALRFQQLCGLVDSNDCLSGIFPVDGQKAAFPDDSPKKRNFEILGLGNKGDPPLF